MIYYMYNISIIFIYCFIDDLTDGESPVLAPRPDLSASLLRHFSDKNQEECDKIVARILEDMLSRATPENIENSRNEIRTIIWLASANDLDCSYLRPLVGDSPNFEEASTLYLKKYLPDFPVRSIILRCLLWSQRVKDIVSKTGQKVGHLIAERSVLNISGYVDRINTVFLQHNRDLVEMNCWVDWRHRESWITRPFDTQTPHSIRIESALALERDSRTRDSELKSMFWSSIRIFLGQIANNLPDSFDIRNTQIAQVDVGRSSFDKAMMSGDPDSQLTQLCRDWAPKIPPMPAHIYGFGTEICNKYDRFSRFIRDSYEEAFRRAFLKYVDDTTAWGSTEKAG